MGVKARAIEILYICLLVSFITSCKTDKMDHNELVLGTFNCRGHAADRIDYIRELMNKCDILMLQEHCCLEANISWLESLIGNVNVYGISGMDERSYNCGRPYGGCAFVCRKGINCSVEPIKSESKRMYASILKVANGFSILAFIVYMPYDTTVSDQYNLLKYNSVL